MRTEETQQAIDEIEFIFEEALSLEWQVGFRDRGMGRGDYAVICNTKKFPIPVLIAECKYQHVAQHICDLHNIRLNKKEI